MKKVIYDKGKFVTGGNNGAESEWIKWHDGRYHIDFVIADAADYNLIAPALITVAESLKRSGEGLVKANMIDKICQ